MLVTYTELMKFHMASKLTAARNDTWDRDHNMGKYKKNKPIDTHSYNQSNSDESILSETVEHEDGSMTKVNKRTNPLTIHHQMILLLIP